MPIATNGKTGAAEPREARTSRLAAVSARHPWLLVFLVSVLANCWILGGPSIRFPDSASYFVVDLSGRQVYFD